MMTTKAKSELHSLIEKLNPARFSKMSGKMAAIVGFILGIRWNDPYLIDAVITSDGFLIVYPSNAPDLKGEFIGGANDLTANWHNLLNAAELTPGERARAEILFRQKITDWTRGK